MNDDIEILVTQQEMNTVPSTENATSTPEITLSVCDSPPMGRCRWEERTTGYSLANALRPKRGTNSRLIEHFVVVGAPPDLDTSNCSESLEEPTVVPPQMLYQFPTDTPLPNEYITKMCFPNGVAIKPLPRTASLSHTNEIMFGNLAEIEKSEHSYIFLMTTDSHLLYGICVTQWELVQDRPSMVPPKPKSEQSSIKSTSDSGTEVKNAKSEKTETSSSSEPNNSTTTTDNSEVSDLEISSENVTSEANSPNVAKKEPADENIMAILEGDPENIQVVRKRNDFAGLRCYCFLSKFPFFRLHFEAMYSLLARERLYRIESFMNYMSSMTLDPFAPAAATPQESNQVLAIVQAYYDKFVPKEGSTLKFSLPGELRSFEFTCPPGNEDIQIAEWGIPTLFHKLSLHNIITLLTAILIEKQTIIVCNNLGYLSAVTLSLLPLLRPYVYQGVFVPILPATWTEYLQAPVPFVIGMRDLTKEQQKLIGDDKVIVWLEKDKIIEPKAGIPSLPEEKRLTDKLKPFHKEVRANAKSTDPFKDKHYSEQVHTVLKAFREYHSWLMDSVIIKHLNLEQIIPSTDGLNASYDTSLNTLNSPQPPIVDEPDPRFLLSEALDPRKIKEIVATMPSQYRKFMESFLVSQQFNVYTEKLIEIMQKPPQLMPPKPTLQSSPSFTKLKVEVKGHHRRSSLGDLAAFLRSGMKS